MLINWEPYGNKLLFNLHLTFLDTIITAYQTKLVEIRKINTTQTRVDSYGVDGISNGTTNIIYLPDNATTYWKECLSLECVCESVASVVGDSTSDFVSIISLDSV